MRLLSGLDADEVSLVRRAANRRGLVLKGDDVDDDGAVIADIMEVPWEHEGAMVDELRRNGADETVLKSAVGAMRLLNGIADELPDGLRERVEKLGTEMYATANPKLNTGDASDVPGHDGQLTGSAPGTDKNHAPTGNGGQLSGGGRDGELSGRGAGAKVAADNDADAGSEPDWDEDDEAVSKAYDEAVAKKDYNTETRRQMAANGQAMAGGRYPIKDREDLHDAILAVGRGKGSHAAIRAHIRQRARALGATGMLPDTWKVAKEDEERRSTVSRALSTIAKAFGAAQPLPDEWEHIPLENDDLDTVEKEGGTVESHAVPVRKEDGTWDFTGVPAEMVGFYRESVEKADRLEAELVATRERLEKTEDKLRTDEIIQKAEEQFKNAASPEDLVPILKEARDKLDPETYEKLEGVLATASERVSKGDLFAEMGRTHGGAAKESDAWAKIEKAAEDLVEKSDTSLSQSQAIDRVLTTPEGRQLYSQYLAESNILGGVA